MPSFNSWSARLCEVARPRPFSVVYWSVARTRSAGGAAATAPPVSVRTARMAATMVLPFKNLLLADGDRLAPPALVAGERDVLPRDLRRRAFRVAHGESQVLVGGEVRPMLVPRVPFLTGGATRRGDEHGTDQQELATDAS